MSEITLIEALELWRQAYAVLRHPSRPADALLQAGNAVAVANWIRTGSASWPASLRPKAGCEDAFARMLCSFPSTSGNARAALLRSRAGRAGRRLRTRAEHQATELKRQAFERLAAEAGLATTPEDFERICEDTSLGADLNLVTYANELMRRLEFQSQGLSVYALWLALDPEVRRRLDAPAVQAATTRLVQHLQTAVSTTPIA